MKTRTPGLGLPCPSCLRTADALASLWRNFELGIGKLESIARLLS